MNGSRNSGTSKWVLIGLFSAIALVLAVGGYWFNRHETQAIKNHEYKDLKAIAELKVNQIVRWRYERTADARLNSSAPFLRSAVLQWMKTPGSISLKTGIMDRLKLIKDSSGYENVILVDTNGRVLFTLNPRLIDLELETRKLVAKTVSVRNAVFGDFFRCSVCNQIHLDVAAPMLNQAKQPVAVLILRTNPGDYLYHLIQSWPTTSKSAETLLIRKEENDVLFLNSLRHRADPPLTLRIPLSRTELPAARASLGGTGLFEGLDYRGVKVLSDIRPVPGSPWFMVAKMDKDEILSEAAERARLIGFLTMALVAFSGVGMAFLYKHQGKRAFQALYQAERERAEILEQARVTLYSIGDAVITVGPNGRVRQMNPVAEHLTGWKETEALGKPLSQIFHIINEETRTEVENPVERVLREGVIIGLANHTLLIARDGTERPIADSGAPIQNETGEIIGVVLVFRDQTEERKNLAALQESLKEKAFLANLIEQSSQPLGVGFPDGRLGLVNSAFCNLVGYSKEDLKSFDWVRVLTPQEWLDGERVKLKELYQTGRPVRYEKEYIRKDGSRVPIELFVHLVRDENRKQEYYYAFVTDISERKRAQEALLAQVSHQDALLSAIPDIIMEVDENKIYTWANRPGLEFFGPDVIGREAAFYFEGEQSTYDSVQPLFNGDENVIYLESWQRCKDGQKRLLAWWCRVMKNSEGKVTGALSTARDVTEQKQAEEKIQNTLDKLRKALGGIVQVISQTVEMRDPYTAGHQRRVADLSRAIAQEMGLLTERVEGIRMAGVIHDLGKISIPAEILSKPGRLTDLEFSLIKMHPEAGYEVLKNIDFPWPIARMVLEHHERIDGSGYPQGLKGEEILWESRILAVADVVEAIATHRPYRPAFGIDVALEEISRQKGILYDVKVVDACLRLFKEKGFTLE